MIQVLEAPALPSSLAEFMDRLIAAFFEAQGADMADELHEHTDAPDHHCVACGVCLSPLAQQDGGTCLGVAA